MKPKPALVGIIPNQENLVNFDNKDWRRKEFFTTKYARSHSSSTKLMTWISRSYENILYIFCSVLLMFKWRINIWLRIQRASQDCWSSSDDKKPVLHSFSLVKLKPYQSSFRSSLFGDRKLKPFQDLYLEGSVRSWKKGRLTDHHCRTWSRYRCRLHGDSKKTGKHQNHNLSCLIGKCSQHTSVVNRVWWLLKFYTRAWIPVELVCDCIEGNMMKGFVRFDHDPSSI